MTSPNARRWRSRSVLGIGEAMIEFAPLADGLFRRGFAGDTLNTCWHMAQLLGDRATVGYATRVGRDFFSDLFVDFIAANRLDASPIQRDPERSMGLYVISLKDAERSFSYWRDASAARRLADDVETLQASMRSSALIHVSGITLAVVGKAGRDKLFRALAEARASGAFVSFDPNVRLRLWADAAELKSATEAMLELTDIALPSFDDEALVWADADPEATVSRLAARGVEEIVVKNGAGDVHWRGFGAQGQVPTPPASEIRDTTGAGDAFDAGYLAARFEGLSPPDACAFAQGVAAEALRCFGALAAAESLAPYRERLRAL